MLNRIFRDRFFYILLVIIVLGFLLRAYKVTSQMPLDVDEYSIGYNAYSIAQTGKDEWGVNFPIFFKAFGDYKLSFDIYSVALLFKLFGAHDFLLKLPAIIIGTLYIPLIYFFLSLLFPQKKFIPIFGSFLMALSPYNIYFSRIISGSISEAFLIVLSIFFFILFFKTNKKIAIFLSFLTLGLSLFSYPSSWIVAPFLFLTYLYLIIRYKRSLSFCTLYGIIFLIFFLPTIYQLLFGGSLIRVKNQTFKGITLEINEVREHTKNNVITQIFHNKLTYYAYNISLNYLRHFDINYLGFSKKYVGFQESSYPPLYFILVPFYYIGLIYLLRNWKDPIYFLLIVWVLISPLPSMITETDVSTKRYLSFLGSEIILSMIGLNLIVPKLKKQILFSIFLLILLFLNIFHFIYHTYIFLPEQLSISNTTVLSSFIKENYTTYDLLVYTSTKFSEPQIFPAYILKYPPSDFWKINKKVINSWYFADPYDKFFYSADTTDIGKKIKLLNKKKVIGLFDNEELASFPPTTCYKLIKKYIVPNNKLLNKVILKPC